jgi:hypothetical protein
MPKRCSAGKKSFARPHEPGPFLSIDLLTLNISNLHSRKVLLKWKFEQEYKEC